MANVATTNTSRYVFRGSSTLFDLLVQPCSTSWHANWSVLIGMHNWPVHSEDSSGGIDMSDASFQL